jgi:hypothetical protein
MFNEICTRENIPQQWTVASICPIYKKRRLARIVTITDI